MRCLYLCKYSLIKVPYLYFCFYWISNRSSLITNVLRYRLCRDLLTDLNLDYLIFLLLLTWLKCPAVGKGFPRDYLFLLFNKTRIVLLYNEYYVQVWTFVIFIWYVMLFWEVFHYRYSVCVISINKFFVDQVAGTK